MRKKRKNSVVVCDVCGKESADLSVWGLAHRHDMHVFSFWNAGTGNREYFDLCSKKCIRKFVKTKLPEVCVFPAPSGPSSCCGAAVVVQGHTTHWYACYECGMPCDVVKEKETSNGNG